jgi:hypothetical protein
MQAGGHGKPRRWNRRERALGRVFALRLQHRLRHLLHEQRNAVGALDDVLPEARRDELVADDEIDYGGDFPLCQPINTVVRSRADRIPA